MNLFRKFGKIRAVNGSGDGQGGTKSWKSFAPSIIIYLILGIWILSSTFYVVDADEQGVIKRFGKYSRTDKPGVHFKLPWPIEEVQKPKVTEVKRIEIGFRTIDPGPPASYREVSEESLMLTGDLNIVSSEFIAQYRIKSPEEYLFNAKDVEIVLRDAAEAAKRQVVGDKEIDYVLTVGKAEIQEEVRSLLQEIMDSYRVGIYIVAVQLQDVQPPKPVIGAFKDVASAKEDKDKFINQAEAYRNQIIPRAQGEAQKLLNEARGYKAEKVNRAEGEANRFLKVLEETKKAEDVTRKRLYLETMESVLSGMDKFIIDSKNNSSLNILDLKGKNTDEILKQLQEGTENK
jgi:membrane protease subunit HflK